jgi:putative phosphoribosyl transferase
MEAELDRFQILKDRKDAGRRLAERLLRFRGENPVVLGIPRGGVVVAAEIAEMLNAPLDILAVRKIGAPINPEYGLGAVAEGGIRLLDGPRMEELGYSAASLEPVIERELKELERRIRRYREGRSRIELRNRTVILVDDGVATGGTVRVAIQALRALQVSRIVLALGVCPPETYSLLRREADDIVVLAVPRAFYAVGEWYREFEPVEDDEVCEVLRSAALAHHPAPPDPDPIPPRARPGISGRSSPTRKADPDESAVRIPVGKVWLDADFAPPSPGEGIVIFAHGSGSGRKSPRNRQVARILNSRGIGTLLLDLLANSEAHIDELTAEYRFNIPLLTERLLAATDWLALRPEGKGLPLGYFGASTGGAVAMIAAAGRTKEVGAIVLRGARTDLGDSAAARIRCPTLILVGGNDEVIQELNAKTMQLLRCEKKLVIVPGASHLFEEPGTLEQVAKEATDWFELHLSSPTLRAVRTPKHSPRRMAG